MPRALQGISAGCRGPHLRDEQILLSNFRVHCRWLRLRYKLEVIMATITFVPESIILKQSNICANSTLNEIFHLTCPKRSCEVAQEPLETIFAKRTFILWSLKCGDH